MTRFAAVLTIIQLALLQASSVRAEGSRPSVDISPGAGENMTLVVRNAKVREVFDMISRTQNVNIAVSDKVDGELSISLFDIDTKDAIDSVAQAAGFAVEVEGDTYLIVQYDELGLDTAKGTMDVRSFKVQYSEPDKVREILEKHLSRHGKITALVERRMIVVEDKPEFLERVERILDEIDQQPTQILLEAKLLEVALTKNDTLGIDWSRISKSGGTEVNMGLRGLTTGSAPGLFFTLLSDNLEGAIEALTDAGRVRALATPRLLTMENEEAEVLVGDRLGYRVTTTINQVTTESVEFVESGVILRFTATVDRQGRVLLDIHPEVSTGTITDGVPSVTTTELSTQLLAEDGERVFIGGLIRNSASEGRRGVPLLSRIPWLGLLFARNEWTHRSTETIVIVKPTVILAGNRGKLDREQKRRLERFEPALETQRFEEEDHLDAPWKSAVKSEETTRPPLRPKCRGFVGPRRCRR